MNLIETYTMKPLNFSNILLFIFFPITAIAIYFLTKTNFTTATNKGEGKKERSDGDIENIANQSWQAMSNFGTDEDTLFNVIGDLSGNDLVRVFNAYGKKPYNSGLGSSSGFLFGEEINLFAWYTNELSKPDLNRMKTIWLKSNLKF